MSNLLIDNKLLMQEYDFEKNLSLDYKKITIGSNKNVWWRCPKGHSYEARMSNRAYLNRGCPYCSGSKTLEGYNDFKTWCFLNNRDDLMQEWNYEKNEISPSSVSPKNNKKVWWRCVLGHEWESTIGSRTSGRPSGCPYCSKPPKRILVGFNDFESWCINNRKEYLLKEWNDSGVKRSFLSFFAF